MSRNVLYLVIGLLAAGVLVVGYLYYQESRERHRNRDWRARRHDRGEIADPVPIGRGLCDVLDSAYQLRRFSEYSAARQNPADGGNVMSLGTILLIILIIFLLGGFSGRFGGYGYGFGHGGTA